MKIAIVGYGVEGRSNYRYYRAKHPEAEITIFDERLKLSDAPEEAKLVLGDKALAQVEGFDLVLRSPSIAPDRIKQTDHHWSATREFLRQSPAPIIGVTGSKGKGTTCSLIASILRQHLADQPERHVHLLGNIGVPALDILSSVGEDDIVVYELSSFQLWDCTQSPTIAVVTMIEPDHLNVHRDYRDYVQAKLHILDYQHDGDTAVYNQSDAESAELIRHIVVSTQADDLPYPYRKGAHFDDHYLYMDETKICPVSQLQLPGRHNLLNACAAIAATWEITNHDSEATAKGLGAFEGLPHRLKFVGETKEVKFYDDSIATTPGSAIAALQSFTQSKVLIVGGSDKGADYHGLGKVIDQSNMRAVLAIGANRTKVAEQVMDETKKPVVMLPATEMPEIVQTAYDLAHPGDVVILSPAAASFDMFKSYADRGEQFIKAVGEL